MTGHNSAYVQPSSASKAPLWLGVDVLGHNDRHEPAGLVEFGVAEVRAQEQLQEEVEHLGVHHSTPQVVLLQSKLSVLKEARQDGSKDSGGEGGSGIPWLRKRGPHSPLLDQVMSKLMDGGLVVTDGSNGNRTRNPYREFLKYHWTDAGEEAVQQVSPFIDREGRGFSCVGYAGRGYGPTLVWQMRQPQAHVTHSGQHQEETPRIVARGK